MTVGMLCICLFAASCGGRDNYNWKASRGGQGDFSFERLEAQDGCEYVLNRSSKRIHRADCRYVKSIKDEHRLAVADPIEAQKEDYRTCAVCFAQNKITEK